MKEYGSFDHIIRLMWEKESLRNALIQTAEMEMMNPDPVYELLMDKPEFLPDRIDRIDQAI